MTLTKREIARAINDAEPAVSIGEAVGLVDTIFLAVRRGLGQGDKVMITNFGTFRVVERAARRGVNPATGEPMTIPAHHTVTFTPAPALEQVVNE